VGERRAAPGTAVRPSLKVSLLEVSGGWFVMTHIARLRDRIVAAGHEIVGPAGI
jgi:hypothetical protein